MRTRDEHHAIGLLFIASFLWGSSFVGSKICLNAGMLPFETVFYRMAIGVTLIGLVFRKSLTHMSIPTLRVGILLGMITSAVYTVEMYGISMTETSKASFLTSTNIVMMPLLCAVFFRVRPKAHSLIAVALAITGVWLLNLGSTGKFLLQTGDLLLLTAAFLYAMNSIVVAKFGAESPPIQITFLQLLTTMVYTGVMTFFQGRSGIYSKEAVGAILYLAIGPTLVCFLIKNYALQHLSPMKCTLILSTEGIFCALLSITLLREQLTLHMLSGIALIFAGIAAEEFGEQVWRLLSNQADKEQRDH